MKHLIKKAPAEVIEVNIFRHGDSVYVDIGKEQYVLSLKSLNNLEDLDLRSTSSVAN